MHGSRPHSRSWRQFIGEVLEDLLVLDAGVIEKERNGSTGGSSRCTRRRRHDPPQPRRVRRLPRRRLRPDARRPGHRPLRHGGPRLHHGQPADRRAVLGLRLLAPGEPDRLASPPSCSRKYNASYFEKGSVPEGILNLGEDVGARGRRRLPALLDERDHGQAVGAPDRRRQGRRVDASGAQSNRDMQFMEYQQWLLKKMCAVYQIAPQEVGELEDVNRSTADDQKDSQRGPRASSRS
jgi:hypothetical protein